jgi:Asp/Glu/hydantoin racemase
LTGSFLDGLLSFLGQSCDVLRLDVCWQAPLVSQLHHECLVLVRFGAAQTVVEMSNMKGQRISVAQTAKDVK